jgi:glucose-6-phosphate isomerase
VTILGVEEFGAEVPLPEAPEHLEGLEYLSGRTMKELLKAEEKATAWALAISKRPTVRITLEKALPPAVGALLQMLMVQTSIAGEMLGINPYDQPGVEAGKQAAMALMGKTGAIPSPTSKGLPAEATSYETLRRQIEKDTA